MFKKFIYFILFFLFSHFALANNLQDNFSNFINNFDIDKFNKDIELLKNISEKNNDQVFRNAGQENFYTKYAKSTVYIETDSGRGSGIVINNSGQILTNSHVINGAKEINVVFKPTKGIQAPISAIHEAKIIKEDRMADLALIEPLYPPNNVYPLPIASDETIDENIISEEAHCIGHPSGLTWTYTKGTISSVRKNHEWPDYSEKFLNSYSELTEEEIEAELKKSYLHIADVIQIDCSINPGNSGGPLIDNNGILIGINTMGLTELQLISFAIASTEINRFLSSDETYEPIPMSDVIKIRKNPRLVQEIDENNDGIIERQFWDTDVNGVQDLVLIDTDQDGVFDLAFEDINENNIIDSQIEWSNTSNEQIAYFDVDEDGTFDYKFTDMDGNGEYEIKEKIN
jgi:S1-C subfamily serine protease